MSYGVNVMVVVLENVIEMNVEDIPLPCKQCIYWEFPELFEELKTMEVEKRRMLAMEKKKEWFIKTLKDFGNCGKIVYHNDSPIGYAQYAPSSLLPQVKNYKSRSVGKVEDGVIFLSCLYLPGEEWRGKGIGKMLLTSILNDLKARGFKAIETFARESSSENPSGPLEFYLKNGFKIIDAWIEDFPLVRLKL